MQGVGAAEKVFEYIDRKPKHNLDGQEAPEMLQGLVEFRNVTFAYPTRPETDVLKVSLHVLLHHFRHLLCSWGPSISLVFDKAPACVNILLAECVLQHPAREGDGSGGTLRQWEKFLCFSAGELLYTSEWPSAAGRPADRDVPAQLPSLQGKNLPLRTGLKVGTVPKSLNKHTCEMDFGVVLKQAATHNLSTSTSIRFKLVVYIITQYFNEFT